MIVIHDYVNNDIIAKPKGEAPVQMSFEEFITYIPAYYQITTN